MSADGYILIEANQTNIFSSILIYWKRQTTSVSSVITFVSEFTCLPDAVDLSTLLVIPAFFCRHSLADTVLEIKHC